MVMMVSGSGIIILDARKHLIRNSAILVDPQFNPLTPGVQ